VSRSRCKSCHAEIVWCTTSPGGKRMPVDPDPIEGGNVMSLRQDGMLGDSGGFVEVDSGLSLLDDDSRPRYVSHFTTCPNADEHRRQR
jgi:hypothetical protein